ncbi:hypothetical protein V6N12_069003 [Hibiscus sabdariffa]|uniref:Uncharacterized protein n=1 Tax=Hibiscus sabdariffa TaxID=183260 RepID=A0ABR2CAE0_9ROSI
MHHYKVINSSGGDKLANEKEINVIGRGVLLKSGSENHTLFFIGFCSTRDHVTNAMIEELFDTISVERSLEDSVANVLFSNMHDGSSVGMSTMPDQGLGAPEISILAKFNEWLAGRDDGAELVRHDSIVSVSSKCSSGDSDPSKVKRARPNTFSVMPRNSKGSKAGMSSYKNIAAEVDHQPHRGK